ncbi:DUF2953 domain-containing protein [Methanolobus psychrotolerans]|uniref:DUF2953 domain-containing protein n=1 Tax=Methanolobus psychrotolerans TaxID=1874706 RepID=UPI000B91916E|nr:DUF2953 domain-containing protein [Methanolobus psychrotolerans]
MLSVLTVILLLIVLAVLLVLFAAIDIVFEAKGSGLSIEHSVTVHWLVFSRLVSPAKEDDDIPVEVENANKFVSEQVTRQFQKPKKQKKIKKISFSEIVQLFKQLKAPVLRLLDGIIHAVRIPYAKVNIVFGFVDPAYTGMAYGYAWALTGYLACHSETLKIKLVPHFVDRRLDLDMSGKVRIRLYRFIPVILLFILDGNVLRFSWHFLRKSIMKRASKKPSVNL